VNINLASGRGRTGHAANGEPVMSPLTGSLCLSNPGEIEMPSIVDQRNAAGDRWVAAVTELRAAFVELSALDQICRSPSFGEAPDVISLRHQTFLPDLGGRFTDGIPEAVDAIRKR
jgi:hypothetical protein